MSIPITTSPDNPDPVTLKAALDAKRDELTRMDPTEVITGTGLDASSAAGVVIGCLPRIDGYRDEIVAQFGDEGRAKLDDLPTSAYAAEQANVELAASDAANDLSEMHDDLAAEHALILTDADALANRKLIDRSRVDAGRPVQGYRTVVTSTLVLVSLVRESWDRVHEVTPLTTADLDRIERKAQAMLRRLNEREQGSTRLPAAEMRTRALSNLVRTYGEVRRMITFVRWWQEDADAIAPSLYAGRSRRSKTVEVEPAPVAPPSPIPAPAPNSPFTT